MKKILSKMGISLLTSYHGAQIFEAIGLGPELIDAAFVGTPPRIGGLTFRRARRGDGDVRTTNAARGAEDAERRCELRLRQVTRRLEYHANNQPMSGCCTRPWRSRRQGRGLGDFYKSYKSKEQAAGDEPVIRDMLEIDSDREPIDIDEVESVEAIMKRFCTGGMSLGAISREAHETIAIGVNRAGGRSNSGEGGEDPQRGGPSPTPTMGNSATFPHLKGVQNGDVATSEDQAGRVRALRRDAAFLMSAGADRDQGGAGRQARRGRPAPRRQGEPVHRVACARARRA